jgi:DUF971 family protein
MTTASDLRSKPANVKVHITSGEGVDVTWADGHYSHYSFVYLRQECPCAVCNDERIRKDKEKSQGVVALPMFKEKVRAKAAKAVGQYAIQIDFSDGHSTGIYSFEYLRSACPCSECKPAA